MLLRVLGPFEATDGTVPLRLGGPRQRALLARLALDAPRAVAIDSLVDDLWGDDPPETAAKMVQIHVSGLRKALPQGTLVTSPPGYRLAIDPEDLDLHRFERLRAEGSASLARGEAGVAGARLSEALALWTGPALAEFAEPFARVEAVRLEELRLAAVEDRLDADLALGRHADVVAELETLIARHRLRERLRAQHMLALYRCGRQAEALAVYRTYRQELMDELGIDPSLRLRELEAAILRQDPALDAPPSGHADPAAARPSAPAQASPAPAQPRPAAPVGRERELAALRDALDGALAGRRGAVFLTGEAGVGKTTLLEAFLAEAPARGPLLVGLGVCVEHHGPGEPYEPVLDALAALVRGERGDAVLAALARIAPTWLVQMPWLVPEGELERLQERALSSTRQRMLREMVEVTAALARELPLVLVVEDLHWSDPSTLDLLAALMRRREPARLLVVGTCRSAGPSASEGVEALIREGCAAGLCAELALGGLGEEDLARYLSDRFPDSDLPPAVAGLLRERTGGNPLFVRHLVDHWVAEGRLPLEDGRARLAGRVADLASGVPRTLGAFLEAQLAGLDADAGPVLRAGSVAGPDWSAATIAVALDRSLGEVEATCADLARAGEVIEARGPVEWPDGTVSAGYAFTHDMHREVLYDRIPDSVRAELHEEIGLRLERAWGLRAPEHATELAHHFTAARDLEPAVRYLKLAADRAFARNAHEEGIAHLRDALAATARLPRAPWRRRLEVELLSQLGQALVATHGWSAPEAEEALLRARALALELRDNEPLVSVLLALATLYELRGEYARSQGLAEQCMSLDGDGPPGRRLGSHELLACNLFHQGSFARALEHAELGAALFERGLDSGHYDSFPATLGDNAGVSCHDWAGLALWFLGYPDDALQRARRALELAGDASRSYSLATAQAQMAFVHQCRLEEGETLGWAEATIRSAEERGYTYRVAMGRILRGWALAAGGSGDEGIEEIVVGLADSRATGAHMDDAHYLGLLADAHLRAGDARAGLETVEEALKVARRERSSFYEPELHRLRAMLLLAGGRSEAEVEECLERALSLAQGQSSRSLALRVAMGLARLRRRRGRDAEARGVLATVFDGFEEGFDAPELREAATLLGRTGPPPAASRPTAPARP